MIIDQELTPARSSAIHKRIGALVATKESPAAGEAEPAISQGCTGALKVLVKVTGPLLFLSYTRPVIVIGCSTPKSKS
jgi:hypothetical protein